MSKLVSYDSGDESASDISTSNKEILNEEEDSKESCQQNNSLDNEWDSFNQMISGASQNTEALVSYPTRSFQTTSDHGDLSDANNVSTKLSDSKPTSTQSGCLYDPMNHSSDDDDDDDNEKHIQKIDSPAKEQNNERKFREKIEECEKNLGQSTNSEIKKSSERKDFMVGEDKCKRNTRDSSCDDSPKHKKRRISPSHKKSIRNRSRSRDRSKERHRRRHGSRDRSSSRNRHKHQSSRRNRSRSRSKHRESKRYDRRRSRSNSHNKNRRSKHSSSRITGPMKGPNNPKNFKEQLKAMFLQTQNQTAEEIERDVLFGDKNLSIANERKSSLALNNSNPSTATVPGGSKATSQQALAHTMAAMHAKVQEITGVSVPKYYNPAAINPIKYAEQLKKRKLLWSKNKEVEKDKEVDVKTQAQWSNTSFVSDQDGKVAAKFRKLMGIKEDERLAALANDEDLSKLTEEQRKKQEEMFHQLAREYDFARMTTHTCRGVGLGFTSHNLPQS